jgi:hypothetical protein
VLARSLAVVALAAWLLPPGLGQAQVGCRFVLGFATLRDLIGPAVVGDCLEDEYFNPANGNVEQRTSGGLLVWRKTDNWTAFTDGYRTWVNGPFGLQQRLNTERFDWETDPAPPPGSATPAPPPSVVSPSPAAQPAVDAVVRAAAAHLGISADQVRVELVEEREWRDSSLGCPQPGFFYSQVVTPGYLVIVTGAGKRLEYHTDTRGRAVLCREL